MGQYYFNPSNMQIFTTKDVKLLGFGAADFKLIPKIYP